MEFTLDCLISVTSIAIIGFYSWSLKGHFSSARMAWGARGISAAVIGTTVLFLYLMWTQPQVIWAQVLGLLIQIAAATLFWWAIWASRKARLRFAFDPALPHSIVSEGPYRYFRHPFYTSYLLFWSGWALASWSAWSVLPVLFFATAYVVAALNEEKKFDASSLAGAYREYKSRTGFFTPRLRRG
ncbi:isoprenylcysteine carboxylmethyltransferase family protein [Rhizobium sp. Root1220]|uniref:methyltransferase family protein n=1 Tax=Rhizobium sp. Root1220 TaxID=1736432 RepID=UPI0006F83DAC|nr:isoprenylcysteine carboxylmethyltransferase family protein [Rhizobium sp. Root1220]KQV81331.1 S-isoprenylcysteine methyltransferase [Rhizobium sp. Root1220]